MILISNVYLSTAEDKEPSPPKQQVRITFNEEPKPPVRQRIRLKRDTEQNENSVPATNTIKTFKRERQIYLPPGRKRTGKFQCTCTTILLLPSISPEKEK